MEIAPQKILTFNGVDIINIKFDSIQPNDGKAAINISVVPKVFYPAASTKDFNILMAVTLTCKDFFDLYINSIGYFSLDKDIDENTKKSFINSNAPAIMFPYLRSFINTLTANMGNATKALNIPPHFFKGDLEEISNTPNTTE